MKVVAPPLIAALTSLCLAACGNGDKQDPTGKGVSFENEIKPLLTSTCLPCHHSQTLLGNLNLESRKTAFGSSSAGRAFIVPGEPDKSLLYLVTEKPHGKTPAVEKMPAMENVFLQPAERDLLRRWIEQGADWPSGEAGWLKPLIIDAQES